MFLLQRTSDLGLSRSKQYASTVCCQAGPVQRPVANAKQNWVALAALGCSVASMALPTLDVAQARIRTDQILQASSLEHGTRDSLQAGFSPSFIQQWSAPAPAPAPASSTRSRAADAMQRLAAARTAVDEGRFEEALAECDAVVQMYGDLALAEYARMGRALLLYQVGRTSDALLQLDDEQVSMVGSAEVHAALASILYVERPVERLRAEQEWDVACEFDQRYKDVSWVKTAKHWPPRALSALERFLALQ